MSTPGRDEFERIMGAVDRWQREGEHFSDPIAHLDFPAPEIRCERLLVDQGKVCDRPAQWAGGCRACQEPVYGAVCGSCRNELLNKHFPIQCGVCKWAGMAAVMFRWVWLDVKKK